MQKAIDLLPHLFIQQILLSPMLIVRGKNPNFIHRSQALRYSRGARKEVQKPTPTKIYRLITSTPPGRMNCRGGGCWSNFKASSDRRGANSFSFLPWLRRTRFPAFGSPPGLGVLTLPTFLAGGATCCEATELLVGITLCFFCLLVLLLVWPSGSFCSLVRSFTFNFF